MQMTVVTRNTIKNLNRIVCILKVEVNSEFEQINI